MRYLPTVLRHRDPARAGLLALRTTAAAAMLLGTMTVGLNAAGAPAEEDAGTYESPTFGYTLEWDADRWSVEADTEAGADYPRDLLQLRDVDGTTALFVEASEEDWSSTDDCVAGLFAEIQLDPADGQAVEDENGDPFEVSEDDRSLAAYVFPIEVDGDTQDQVRLVECRADPDSDLIVGFTAYSGIVDAYPEDGYPLVGDIADSLSFAGGATPEASQRGSGRSTPEASRRASASPEASRRGSGRSTPEASASPEANAGVDGNAYVSPTYGYQLEWDEDVWTVEDESSRDDVDSLTLSSDLLVANVVGYQGDGDTRSCVDAYVSVLDDRGDGNAAIATDPDSGDELVFPNDDGSQIEALYIYGMDGENYASRVTCVALADDNILAIEFTAPGADVVSDDASTQISDLLDTIVL